MLSDSSFGIPDMLTVSAASVEFQADESPPNSMQAGEQCMCMLLFYAGQFKAEVGL